MDYYKPKSSIHTTIGIVIVTLILATLANWFRILADDAILNATKNAMMQQISPMEFRLEDTISESYEDLSLLAKYIANENVTIENAAEYIKTQSQAEKFDELYYISLDGTAISYENELFDFSNNSYVKKALEENSFVITQPHISKLNDILVFNIVIPITQNGVTTAVLMSESSINDFYTALESTVNESGDLFIIDQDLNLVFSTKENHIGSSIIPNSDIDQLGYDNILMAQENVKNGISGNFHYDYHGISKVMVFSPIDLTDWALAVNVDTTTVNVELSDAVRQLELICVGIYWFLIFVLAITAISQARSLKLLEKTAYYDNLTDMPNLAKIKKEMHTTLNRNKQSNYSLLKFDIDNFKVVNEIFGFDVGDKILQAPKHIFKYANQPPEAVIARIGVDEFLAFAPTDFIGKIEESTHFYEAFFKKLVPELLDYNLSFKYGRYNIELGETNISEIINKVTLAHNIAKSQKGLVVYDYNEEYKAKLLYDAQITRKMNSALQNNEFKVFLQPKFSVKDNKLIGAEALVRWIDSDGNMIYPNSFIPLFEKNKFIINLDRYILENVCQIIKSWMDKNLDIITISINCSRLNLENANFTEEFAKIANKYNIPHKYLEIELTESATIENEEIIENVFKKLRDYGFKISIDDFGAGYSSLGLIKNMKIDTLKLDRSFFNKIDAEQERGTHVVKTIIDMAHGLDMYVVAEGIETTEQINTLKSINCDAVQGYIHSKPIPTKEFEEKYILN